MLQMIAFSDQLEKLVCQRHRKQVVLTEAEVTNKDRTISRYLSCPKCHITVENTDELQEKLQVLVKTLQEEREKAVETKDESE